MRKLLFVIVCSAMMAFAITPSLYKKVDKFVKSRIGFNSSGSVVYLTDDMKNLVNRETNTELVSDSVIIWRSENKEVAILDYVKSKSTSYDVLVVIDSLGSINEVKIFGVTDRRAVMLTNKRWLKQFVGKSNKSSFDIDAVSGATIASNDIRDAIERLLSVNENTEK